MKAHLAIALLVLFSFSCDQGIEPDDHILTPSSGIVSFSLSKSSIPPAVKLILARLERVGFQTLSDSAVITNSTDSIKLHFGNVPAGLWTIQVEAKDSIRVTRYKGTGSVSVIESQTSHISIQMIQAAVGMGTVEISVLWSSPRFDWSMSRENPVLQQTTGSWDEQHFFFHTPTILKVNGLYRLWYTTGYSKSVNRVQNEWIAYATSADGIHWTKHGAVVHPGPPGSWNEQGSIWPTVIYENGRYKMWFGGNSATAYRTGIGYAESGDGASWTVRTTPVISSSPARPELWPPSVLKKDEQYYLYTGAGTPIGLYLMTSGDGIFWNELGKILSPRSEVSWEKNGIVDPCILLDQNKYRMFYTGYAADNSTTLGYAESVDGINWTHGGVSPALVSSATTPWKTTWVAYGTALKENNRIKLWFSGLTAQPYRWQIGFAEHTE